MTILEAFLLTKTHSRSNFFKLKQPFSEVYFVYSKKGFQKSLLCLRKGHSGSNNCNQEQPFRKCILYLMEMTFHKALFQLIEESFCKQKLQCRIAFPEVHFVSSRMVILEALFLLTKNVFRKIFPSRKIILLEYLYPYRIPCFGNRSKIQNRNTNSKKKS